MECTGRITNIMRDFETNNITVTLSLNEASVQELQDIKSSDKLSIAMKRWRPKRSLDANAYAWVLMSKIAEVLCTSKEEIYELFLQRYGVIYQDDKGPITITVARRVDMSTVPGHWKRYKDNDKFVSYLMIKGTSEYDSAEMAHFIDCIVEEAKHMEIETLPPNELERLKQEWGYEKVT